MNTGNVADQRTLPLVVGVDLGGTQIRSAVLQGDRLLSKTSSLTREDPTPEKIIPRVSQSIRQVVDEANIHLDQVAGIGVGVPGPLDRSTGLILSPPNMPEWDRVPLGTLLKEQFGIGTPVFVEKDTNVAVLGEHVFGAGKNCRSIVYMTISTGIGGAVIIDGKILGGTHGVAGELGHMTIDMYGELCNCGNIGCLEQIASGAAIARRARSMIDRGDCADFLYFARSALAGELPAGVQATAVGDETEWLSRLDARLVSLAAASGVASARAIMARAAEAIGVGLVNILHVFNPEMVILGGGVVQAGSLLLEPALRVVRERAMKSSCDGIHIVQATFGSNVGLVGAGALAYVRLANENIFS